MRTAGPRNRRILVTGGAGFIGSHVAQSLAPTNEVWILDDLSAGSIENLPDDVRFVEGDVREATRLEQFSSLDLDVIFHEAALVDVDRSIEDPRASNSRNATGTLELLELARRTDARAVTASSAAIYGQVEDLPVHETNRRSPSSPYGVDKLMADHYTRLYHELYGLETVALRYFNVYGPGQSSTDYTGVMTAFLTRAMEGRPMPVHGDGRQTRDFVYIDDVVDANLLAAATDHVGMAFNIGSGRRTSVIELANMIGAVTGDRSRIAHTDPRDGDIRHSQADISRANEIMGFEPETSLESGIEETYRAYLKEPTSP